MSEFAMGWERNEKGVENWLNSPENTHPVFGVCTSNLERNESEPVLLYEALDHYVPDFQPLFQRHVGCCVGCAYSHGTSVLMANEAIIDDEEVFNGLASSESIYGLSRVEALGYKSNRSGDGSYGAAACKGIRNYGILTMQDYSKQTRVREHDLRVFSPDKARSFGKYGNGGRSDRGKLDKIAKLHPVRTTSLIRNFDEASLAITNGYPIPICSDQGFSKTRDTQGFCAPEGNWSHAMCIIGVRFDRPGALIVNSWSKYVKGPMWPHDIPEGLKYTSFWADEKVVNDILAQNDSYAISSFDGFETRNVNSLLRRRFHKRGRVRHRLFGR